MEPLKLPLTGLPEGATVTFGGQLIRDNLITGLRGEEGELVVKANGYDEYRETITLSEGAQLDLTDRLQLLEPPPNRDDMRSRWREARMKKTSRQPAARTYESPTPRSTSQPAPRGTTVGGGWERGRTGGVVGGWE